MVKTEWKDETSYRQGERRGETEPRTWGIRLGKLRVSVTRWHYGAKDRWYLCCNPFAEHSELTSTDIEDAKAEALGTVRDWLTVMLDDLNRS